MKKIIKNISNIFLIMLMLFNIGSSYYVSKTNAKYITTGALNYDTGFYKLNLNHTINKSTEINEGRVIVKYAITFYRNPMVYDGESDVYTITTRISNIANTCTLSLANNLISPSDSGTATLTYTQANDTSSITLVSSCDVTDYGEVVPIKIKVDEKVGNDSKINLINETKTYYNQNMYDIILNRINTSTEFDDSIRTYLSNYLNTQINSNDDLLNGKVLKGLTYDMDNFTYSFENEFIGYALSYANNSSKKNKPTSFKFTITDLDTIDTTFKYYLSEYLGYEEEYINLIENYILEKSGKSTLKLALQDIVENASTSVRGITKASTPTDALYPYEIQYSSEMVRNIVNITQSSDKHFRLILPANGSTASMSALYNIYIPYYEYSDLTNNTLIKSEYLSMDENTSKVFVLTDTTTNQKLLINTYRKVQIIEGETYNFYYLRVIPLSNGITINIVNNILLRHFNLIDDPSGTSPLEASNYDASQTSDILNDIGSYVYGISYNPKTFEEFDLTEITDNITYTLSN